MRMMASTVAAILMMSASANAAFLDPALNSDANRKFLEANAAKPGVVSAQGLQYRVIRSGEGDQPGRRDCVTVNYKGSLINGTVFDMTRGTPATFPVNRVIPGWTQVLQLMHTGDDWEVTIPARLAYGANGAGDAVPPNQTLIFEIELLKVTPSAECQ